MTETRQIVLVSSAAASFGFMLGCWASAGIFRYFGCL